MSVEVANNCEHENIEKKFTFDASHLDRSKLKRSASLNMEFIDSELDASQSDKLDSNLLG